MQRSVCVHTRLVTSVMSTVCNPIDCSLPGSSVHGNSPGEEYWSGLPCLPLGESFRPQIKPRSPALQAGSLPTEPPGKPLCIYTQIYSFQIRFRCWLLQNIRYSSLCYTHLLVICFIYQIRSDQSLSCVRLFATP